MNRLINTTKGYRGNRGPLSSYGFPLCFRQEVQQLESERLAALADKVRGFPKKTMSLGPLNGGLG